MSTDRGDLEQAVQDIKARYHYRLYQSLLGRDEPENKDGGPGSGNWGHLGRKGIRGGSAIGTGGVQNRRELPHGGGFTSWSKQRDMVAKPHVATEAELKNLPKGSVLVAKNASYIKKGATFEKVSSGSNSFWDPDYTRDVSDFVGENIRIALNNEANPNQTQATADFGGYRERMEKAPRNESKEDMDDMLRDSTGEAWNKMADKEKKAIVNYTGDGFVAMNEMLRNGPSGSAYYDKQTKGLIKNMAGGLEKSELKQDIWLARGVDSDAFAKMLKIPKKDVDDIFNGSKAPSSLLGIPGTDEGFMSCGTTEGTGFTKPVICHIFAPKGTKGMYVEPVSQWGGGSGLGWDGKSKQNYFGGEFETILQCGTSVQVSRSWKESDQLHVEMFVTGQEKLKGF